MWNQELRPMKFIPDPIPALAAILCLFVVLSASAGTPLVLTAQGQVEGTVVDAVMSFKGIPYAAPPVGDLRWKPTQPGISWPGTFKATAFGNICPQPSPADPKVAIGNEDCLK